MKYRHDQSGAGAAAVLIAVVMTVLFLGATGFGLWAFMTAEDYKNNTDKKIADAVAVAQKQISSQKDNEFAEREKSPLKIFTGPATYGTVSFQYPKTYSGYVVEQSSGTVLDGYFHPNIVPGSNTVSKVPYALRVQVVEQQYDQSLRQYESQIKTGKVTSAAFRPERVPNTLGVRLFGEFSPDVKEQTLILMPLRDKTIRVWTEANIYEPDLTNFVLKTLTFIP